MNSRPVVLQIFLGIGLVIVSASAAAVVGGLMFEGVNWLRTYGLPQTVNQGSIVATVGNGPVLGAIAKIVDLYNGSFMGFARFGAGLGSMAACFWALGRAKQYSAVARTATGCFAGALIGARMVMMITSQPNLVLIGLLLGAFTAGLCMFLSARPSNFKPLPRLNLRDEP